MLLKSSKTFLKGAAIGIIGHVTAWLVRVPVERLYHEAVYLLGHIVATLGVMHNLDKR